MTKSPALTPRAALWIVLAATGLGLGACGGGGSSTSTTTTGGGTGGTSSATVSGVKLPSQVSAVTAN